MSDSSKLSLSKRVVAPFVGSLSVFLVTLLILMFGYRPQDTRDQLDLGTLKSSKRVVICCDPAGTTVYQKDRQGTSNRNPVGVCWEPISLEAFDSEGDTVTFTLDKEGYKAQTFTVPQKVLRTGQWPPNSEPLVVVEPETFLKGAMMRHPVAFALNLLSLLGLAFTGFALYREYGTLKELEALTREADGDPYIGRLISDYRVGRLLGTGGYGAVYMAHDSRNLRKPCYAIKIARYDGINEAMDQELKERFEREMYLVKDLDHRNIGRVIDFDSGKSFSWVLMPLYDGGELEEWIEKGKLTSHDILNFARGIASGLSAAHDKGICHRDLKPANVMIDGDEAVIIDFGLARAVDSKTLTMEGAMMGTPIYMPQEQLMDSKSVTDKADQYAYGVILFEMVTGGKVPFTTARDTGEVMALVQEKLMKGAVPLREVDPEQPEELEKVLAKMMASDAQDRYPNIMDAFRAFEAAYNV